MSTILYLQTDHSEINARSLAGALSCAKNVGVRLQLVEFWRKMSKAPMTAESLKTEFAHLVEFWQATAVIVDCGRPGLDLTAFVAKKVPVVYLDCRRFKRKGGVFIHNDDDAIADAAVSELLIRPLDELAFVGFPGKSDWSRNRCKRFLEIADLNGYKGRVYVGPLPEADSDPNLEAWLTELPKPCGIFAANDFIARHVIACCQRRGLSLPEEVSVVGVDNEHTICESAGVSISSVQCDFFAAGQLAAQLACRLVLTPKARCDDAVFGVSCVVRRQSSRVFKRYDERVVRAVEYIRMYALEGIAVGDVVKHMGCSRRLAELRFREIAGRSILDEIRDVRVTAAMEMLSRPDLSIAEVAFACGYATPSALRKAFLAARGETFAAWRKKCCRSARRA